MAPAAKAAPKEAAAKKAAVKKEKKEKPQEEMVPKVPQPDRAAFDEKMAEVQKDIEKLQAQQQALQKQISERSGGKEEFHSKRVELRGLLDEYSSKIDELQAKKQEIHAVVGEKVAEGREMKSKLQKMKKDIGFTSEGDIEARIKEIELKLQTETMSLKAEKDYMKEIAQLKKNKPQVGKVQEMEASLENFDRGMSMKEKLGVINEEMAKWREMKRNVSEKVGALIEARNSQMGDMGKVIEERDALSAQVREKIALRNTLRDEFREAEKEYNRQTAEIRRLRADKAREERETRNAEWQQTVRLRKAEKLDTQPYVQEIMLIEQTILFCKNLTAQKGSKEKEEAKEVVHNNPDNTEVLLKKEDRDEYWFVPTKGKKAKGNKKVTKGGESGAKPIKHNAETFLLFDKLKLDAPITTAEIPATLEKLETQLEEYNVKVKQWEEQKEEMKRKIIEEGWDPEKDDEKENMGDTNGKDEAKEAEKEKEADDDGDNDDDDDDDADDKKEDEEKPED